MSAVFQIDFKGHCRSECGNDQSCKSVTISKIREELFECWFDSAEIISDDRFVVAEGINTYLKGS